MAKRSLALPYVDAAGVLQVARPGGNPIFRSRIFVAVAITVLALVFWLLPGGGVLRAWGPDWGWPWALVCLVLYVLVLRVALQPVRPLPYGGQPAERYLSLLPPDTYARVAAYAAKPESFPQVSKVRLGNVWTDYLEAVNRFRTSQSLARDDQPAATAHLDESRRALDVLLGLDPDRPISGP